MQKLSIFPTEKVHHEFLFEWGQVVMMKLENKMKLSEKNEKFALKHINVLFCGSYLCTIVLTLTLIVHISQSPRYDLETFLRSELTRHERVKRDEQPKGWVCSWFDNLILFISWLFRRKLPSGSDGKFSHTNAIKIFSGSQTLKHC